MDGWMVVVGRWLLKLFTTTMIMMIMPLLLLLFYSPLELSHDDDVDDDESVMWIKNPFYTYNKPYVPLITRLYVCISIMDSSSGSGSSAGGRPM